MGMLESRTMTLLEPHLAESPVSRVQRTTTPLKVFLREEHYNECEKELAEGQRPRQEHRIDGCGSGFTYAIHATLRELALGGKDVRFAVEGVDVEKLVKIVIILKNDFSCDGLDLASFDIDDPTKRVIEKVDELLYDTRTYIVAADSTA
ncbi:hypothetical protein CYMTET_15305 [Cymbomonas tetramitiformis]|uniref:Uncharacterized protein n=1 Tax=Cymbomonas tetramitiformis TaxID=36881 RepID=A0AAE0GEM5_9CHLO|nr:hypothetical protein CYMTET_15305 [Cymbomonas tetramitiformis]